MKMRRVRYFLLALLVAILAALMLGLLGTLLMFVTRSL